MAGHHSIIIGDTYRGQIAVLRDGEPMDLSDAVAVTMQVRDLRGNLILQPDTTITDRKGGIVQWHARADDTAGLQPCQAKMGVRVAFVGGEAHTAIEAVVTVRKGPVQ